MKTFLLVALVAIATSNAAHLKNKRQLVDAPYNYNAPSNSYGTPVSSFGVPQGSVQTLSYSGAGSIQHVAQPAPSASFSASIGIPNANEAVFQQASFNSAQGSSVPDVASLGFSTAAPFDSSSFQSSGFSTPAPAVSEVANFQVSNQSPFVYSGFGQNDFGAQSVNAGFDVPTYSGGVQSVGSQQISGQVPSFSGAVHSVESHQNSGSVHSVESHQSNGQIPAHGGSVENQNNVQVHSVETHSSGGSINEAFGVSPSAPSNAYSDAVEVGTGPVVEPKVVKNVYFYEAPEDEELVVSPKINYEQQQPTKSYKIIFVKAPSYKTNLPIEIPAPPPHEEKTLVYVLVKKPEASAVVNVKARQPPVQTKPEVFFIKYKTQQEAEEAVAKIQSQQGIQNAQNGFAAGGNQASSIDVSSVLSSKSLPEGSSIAAAGVMSESEANALSAAGSPVTELPEVVVSSQSPESSGEVDSSVVSGGQVDVRVSSEDSGSDVHALSPVTAGPQTYLTGTYNQQQVAAEVNSGVTHETVDVSSPNAHSEEPAPEVIMVNDSENNVEASADASSHAVASAHAQANVEATTQLTTVQETIATNTEPAAFVMVNLTSNLSKVSGETTEPITDNVVDSSVDASEKLDFVVSSNNQIADQVGSTDSKSVTEITTLENITTDVTDQAVNTSAIDTTTPVVPSSSSNVKKLSTEVEPPNAIGAKLSDSVVDSPVDASENLNIAVDSKDIESRLYLPPQPSPSGSSHVSRLYLPPVGER